MTVIWMSAARPRGLEWGKGEPGCVGVFLGCGVCVVGWRLMRVMVDAFGKERNERHRSTINNTEYTAPYDKATKHTHRRLHVEEVEPDADAVVRGGRGRRGLLVL